MRTIELKSPDGWTCEIVERDGGGFSPLRWKGGPDVPEQMKPLDPSPGICEYAFPSARDAMMSAWRERLHRDYLRRNIVPHPRQTEK